MISLKIESELYVLLRGHLKINFPLNKYYIIDWCKEKYDVYTFGPEVFEDMIVILS